MSFASCLKVNIFILKLSGIWLPKSPNKWYFLRALLIVTVHSLFWLSQFLYIVKNITNIVEVSAAAYIFVPLNQNFFKFQNNIEHINTTKTIIKLFDEELFKPRNMKQKQIFEAKKKFVLEMFCGYAFNAAVVCFGLVLMPLFKNDGTTRYLPIKGWFPIDINSNSFWYWMLYLHQVFIVISEVPIAISIDIMAVAFMMFVGMQCDFLCNNLEELEEEAKQRARLSTETIKISKEMHILLDKCIKQQIKIIE